MVLKNKTQRIKLYFFNIYFSVILCLMIKYIQIDLYIHLAQKIKMSNKIDRCRHPNFRRIYRQINNNLSKDSLTQTVLISTQSTQPSIEPVSVSGQSTSTAVGARAHQRATNSQFEFFIDSEVFTVVFLNYLLFIWSDKEIDIGTVW